MNIQQFRQRYPQYDDMSDQELASRLYKRHYSDVPQDKFYQAFGVTQPVDDSALLRTKQPTSQEKLQAILSNRVLQAEGLAQTGEQAGVLQSAKLDQSEPIKGLGDLSIEEGARTAGAVIGGAAMWLPANIMGLATAAVERSHGKTAEEAAAIRENVQNMMNSWVPQPKTATGQKVIELLGTGIEKALTPFRAGGEMFFRGAAGASGMGAPTTIPAADLGMTQEELDSMPNVKALVDFVSELAVFKVGHSVGKAGYKYIKMEDLDLVAKDIAKANTLSEADAIAREKLVELKSKAQTSKEQEEELGRMREGVSRETGEEEPPEAGPVIPRDLPKPEGPEGGGGAAEGVPDYKAEYGGMKPTEAETEAGIQEYTKTIGTGKEVPSAEGIRENAGQVQEGGLVRQGRETEGGEDLEQPAPIEPSPKQPQGPEGAAEQITEGLKPSGLPTNASYHSMNGTAPFEGYAWRTMGESEYRKLLAGEKKYPGGKAGRGNNFAPTPDNATQYAQKGKYLVEFADVGEATGETVTKPLTRENVTSVKFYDGKDWVDVTGRGIQETPLKTPKKSTSNLFQKDRTTIGGFAEENGYIRTPQKGEPYRGEYESLPKSVKQRMFRKNGSVSMDQFHKSAQGEGFIEGTTDLANWVEGMRTDPLYAAKGRLTRQEGEARTKAQQAADEAFEAEMNLEPEAPEGGLVEVTADDLLEGKSYQVFTGKGADGMEKFTVVEKDQFGTILQDGKPMELKPGEKIQVQKSDYMKSKTGEAKQAGIVEEPPPELFDRQEQAPKTKRAAPKEKKTSRYEQHSMFGHKQGDIFKGGGEGAASVGTHGQTARKGGPAAANMGGYASRLSNLMRMTDMVALAKGMLGGRYPTIVRWIRKSGASGLFYDKNGEPYIEVLAKIFENPDEALFTLTHEIGHVVDWISHKTLQTNSNILGRLASLKDYLKHTIASKPGGKEALTTQDRQRIRYLAKKLEEEGAEQWVDEVIKKETPVTPDDIMNIWNAVDDARMINPELYEAVAKMSTAEKKAVVKEALKGVTPDNLKQFAKVVTEKTGKKIKREAYKTVDGKKIYEPWFKEAVNKRYAEMINDEIKKLDLLKKSEIDTELQNLTRVWKPFDPAKDPGYTAYRYSSRELYADAFSAMMNVPELVKSVAPKWYEAWWNYLERKPEVKELYNKIQDDIAAGRSNANASKALRQGFRNYADKWSDIYAREDSKKDRYGNDFIDIDYALHRRLRTVGEKNIPAESNPRYKLEEMRYSGGEVDGYLNDVYNKVIKMVEDAGFQIEDLGEWMYHKRVVSERTKMANPEGFDEITSNERLAEMKEFYGDTLENARLAFKELRDKNIIPKMEKSGMFSDNVMNIIKNARAYATFDVVKYLDQKYGKGVGAKIYEQYGTFQKIGNPFTATIMKDTSIIKAINRNKAKVSIKKFFEKYGDQFPGQFEPARERWVGKRWEVVPEPEGAPLQTIYYTEKGKVKGYNVDKFIAQIFEENPYESAALAKVLAAMATPFRMMFTELNPGFWMFNVLRDYNRLVKSIPNASMLNMAPQLLKAIKPSFRSQWGLHEDLIRDMQENHELISVADYRGLKKVDRQLERMLGMYHIRPEQWNNSVIKPFGRMFNYYTNIGKALERMPKVAGHLHLKEKFPDMTNEELAHIVRTRAGSPDFLRKGRAYPVYNNLLLFSNAMKEGYRGDFEAMGANPGQYIWKQMKYTVFPKALMKLAAAGALGAGVKAIMDGASEYDKTNYTVIPLWMTDSGKSVYLRVPQDEISRFFGGIFWKAMQLDEGKDYANLLDYMAGQAPTINPALDVSYDILKYATGFNPYDSFYGSYAIDEDVFKAGGARAHKEFAKYVLNKMGAGVVYKFPYDDIEANKTHLEKLLGIPVAGQNMIGRFLKVSDRGLKEDVMEDRLKVQSKIADELLTAKEGLQNIVNDKELTEEQAKALMLHPDVVDRNMMSYLSRKYNYLYMDQYLKASTTEEKAVVFQHMIDREKLLEKTRFGKKEEE